MPYGHVSKAGARIHANGYENPHGNPNLTSTMEFSLTDICSIFHLCSSTVQIFLNQSYRKLCSRTCATFR